MQGDQTSGSADNLDVNLLFNETNTMIYNSKVKLNSHTASMETSSLSHFFIRKNGTVNYRRRAL